MATSAPSWASPQTSGQIRRSQALADTIREMQQGRTPDSYRTASATNYNILADAILGYAGANAEKKANEALTADRTRIADMIRGSFPDQRGIEAQQLNADQAFDLTPGANEQRKQQGGIGNLASMIFETTGDPAAALNAGLGQQRQAIEDQRYKDEQQYARGRDARADFVNDRGFGLQSDQFGFQKDSWKQGFDQDASQFGATMDMNKDQFGQTMAYNYAKLAADREADAMKAAASGAPKPEDVGTLRKEWNSQSSDFRGVRDAYSRVQASGDGTTPAQQMSMIFAYMKMLDPTSAVRETEYANAENARGVPTAVQNIWNKLKDGQFLAPSQITDFKNQAASLYQNAEEDYDRSFNFYRRQAEDAGMSPDVIQDFRVPDDPPPVGAPPASITAPNGQTFPREQAISARNFMASLPPHMQDPDFMAQVEALLSQPGPAPEPTDDDLVKKWAR